MSLLRATFALLIFLGLSIPGSFAQSFEVPADTNPEVINAFNDAAQLLNSGQPAEAARKYEIVVKALPNLGVVHYNYGVALGKMGRWAESTQELEKASQLDPSNDAVVFNLGTTYQLAGKYNEALETYKKYLNLFPNGAFAKRVSQQLKQLQTEVNRAHGQSSSGQDNYLSEAMLGRGSRWDASSMPLSVFIEKGSAEGYRDEFTEILKQSFLDWQAASQGRLSIKFVDKAKDALIRCSWTDNLRDLTSPVEGGKAEISQNQQGKIVKAEILLLTSNKKLYNAFSVDYMKHVCMHEIGHALGLVGHSSGPEDMMFAAANPEAATTALSDRDKKTIFMLYSGMR